MTNLEKVRNNIDDYPRIGFATEHSDGARKVYQLHANNIWDLTVALASEESGESDTEIDSSTYEVFAQSGQVRGTFPEGEILFEYQHSAFSDAEINSYLTDSNNSVNKATLKCIEILLSSAAKRFDYKSGIKDIKASQVFDHLKSLRETFTEKVENEDNSSVAGGVFVTREHPAYDIDLEENIDVSRSDS